MFTMRFLTLICMATVFLASLCACPATAQDGPANSAVLQPNILWITSEDNGPQLGCYGDTYADTPNIDALAARGMRYDNCWSNAPVCAPARTTIISGVFPTSLGGQHMRSQVTLPAELKLYPEVFREIGYYCTNNSKEDYNLFTPTNLWDDSSNKAHWRKRKAGQPFFSVFNFTVSHESKIRTRPHTAIHSASEVTVPPYHPDTPEVRQDWAQYYDRITEMDQEVGRVLQQLKDDGLEDSTIVFYYGDHGSGMPRGKRWLYQSGLRVPMIVHIPERFSTLVQGQYQANTANQRLVSFVDLVPTVLSLAGQRPSPTLQGKAFLGKFATEAPQYIYGFRDRMDERYDMSRAVRDEKYAYIRNFYPQRPQGTYLDYMFQTPTTKTWKKLFDEGKLNAAQSFFWQPKPSEELYDLQSDPYQIENLAARPEHAETLDRMREAVHQWMIRVADVGLVPEGEMLESSGPDSPYTFGHDGSRFPVEEIYAVADMATRPTSEDIEELLKKQVHPNPVVRYWVANGLLIRALRDQQLDQALRAARSLMTDTSAYVRCIACETIARYGTENERSLALDGLLKMADPRQTNTFVAMMAMNSLDWCAPTSAEIGQSLVGIPAKDPKLSSRYGSYIPNLLKRIESIAK